MKFLLLFVTTSLLMLVSTTSNLAQVITNQPDKQGDYFSNEAPLKGTASSPLMAGSLWQVVAVRLNCRRAPGSEQMVKRQFKQGDRLQAEVYRGGSDEVLRNALDRNGKPWMPVRGGSPNELCYVRANQRYIKPIEPQRHISEKR